MVLLKRFVTPRGVNLNISRAYGSYFAGHLSNERHFHGSRFFSTPPSTSPVANKPLAQQQDGPTGSLFSESKNSETLGPSLVGQTAQIIRRFSPEANAQAMLNCGGPALAAHASFDPNYGRAVSWIQNHAVGSAVLSPILISGLIGALVEATFPQAIGLQHSMQLAPDKPLLVGATVRAEIEVTSVARGNLKKARFSDTGDASSDQEPSLKEKQMGFHVQMDTRVVRVQDGATIAKGEQAIWIPDYLHM